MGQISSLCDFMVEKPINMVYLLDSVPMMNGSNIWTKSYMYCFECI